MSTSIATPSPTVKLLPEQNTMFMELAIKIGQASFEAHIHFKLNKIAATCTPIPVSK
jgi:hypothetical protein